MFMLSSRPFFVLVARLQRIRLRSPLNSISLADPRRRKEEFKMKARFTLAVIASLLIAAPVWSSISLNSSRSNIYRITYPSDLATPAQVKAILAELDKLGPTDEAKLKRWLPANFKRFGVAGERIKTLIVLPRGGEMKEIGIILLTKPEDEAAARATTIKSSKSNSSD
jgi:hypothetical protein